MKVRVGSTYVYHANLLDATDGRTNLKNGELVKVVNMYGCPPANTMQHAYVVRVSDVTTFVGLVHTNSLHTREEYAQYLRERIATHSDNPLNKAAAEVEVSGEEGTFHGNGVRLSTQTEANAYARDLHSRWTLVIRYRVVESDDEPNYKFDVLTFALKGLGPKENG